ncbi:MAG: hypothetical protein S4CHLAM123_10170 [Chlamydiales bacterium]|nr:hypothetical protein [Chlamydiales bacterium]
MVQRARDLSNGAKRFQNDAKLELFNGLSPIIQGLDPTGRAYVAIRVKNKQTKEIECGILTQRNRETCLKGWSSYIPNVWQGKGPLAFDPQPINVAITQRLSEIVNGSHEEYKLSLKASPQKTES